MQNNSKFNLSLLVVIPLVAFVAFSVMAPKSPAESSSSKKIGPVTTAKANQETATLAGGCFWSMEAIFKQLKGVSSVEPGYAGGDVKNPKYEEVGGGQTGHSETINVIYDPKQISYHDLVKVFLTVHDPTTLDRQGADIGSEYRSRIFYRNNAQKEIAQKTVAEIGKSGLYSSPIVTKIEPYKNFYKAEDYHLNYYNLNPKQGYCASVVGPKVEKFREKFKDLLKN